MPTLNARWLPTLVLSMLVLPLLTIGCGPAPDAEPGAGTEVAAATAAPPSLPQPPLRGVVSAVDGVPIVYALEGPATLEDELPTLVFIHGWSCDRTYWHAQVEAFKDRFRILAIDLPGHGESGTERASWHVAQFGQDVATVLEQLEKQGLVHRRNVLIGHSMGAPVSLAATAALPSHVEGVVVVDALQSVEPMDPARRQPLIEAFETDFDGTCNRFVSSFFLEDSDAQLVERVRASMCAGPPEVVVPLFGSFFEVDLQALLTSVEVPVRLINASLYPTVVQDEVSPREVDLRVEILPETGHFLMMERPDAFNAVLAETLDEMIGLPLEGEAVAVVTQAANDTTDIPAD